jgi:vesicle coat complex subunit
LRTRRFSQALQRVKQPLYSLCRHADPEIALVGLCHACLLVRQTPYAFSDDYQQFLVRHSDAAYVKQKKIDVLKHLTTDANQMVLVHELMEYTKARNQLLSESVAVRAWRS